MCTADTAAYQREPVTRTSAHSTSHAGFRTRTTGRLTRTSMTLNRTTRDLSRTVFPLFPVTL
jgi:hypothetical protein